MLTMLFQDVSSNDNTEMTAPVILEQRMMPQGTISDPNKEPDPTGPGFCR